MNTVTVLLIHDVDKILIAEKKQGYDKHEHWHVYIKELLTGKSFILPFTYRMHIYIIHILFHFAY